MLIIEPKDPDEERDIRFRWNRIFRAWFYIIIITPLFILYYTSEDIQLSFLLGTWTSIIGMPIILAGIMELIINLGSKKRPLVSISNRFIIIATCWAALFITGYIYNQFEAGKVNRLPQDPISSETLSSMTSFAQQESVKEMLLRESKALNKQCPIQISQVMKLDSTSVINGIVFQMNYSFPFTREKMLETYKAMGYDAAKEQESFQDQLTQMYKTQDYLEEFRQKKITVQAAYRDENGKLLYTFSSTPGVDF